VVRSGSKIKHQNDMRIKEIGLRAHTILNILNSTIHIIRRVMYDRLIGTYNLHFDNGYNVHMYSKHYADNGYGLDLDLLS
jgi:hypothetical protein